MLRLSNGKVNKIRGGFNESSDHFEAKRQICESLQKVDKHFVTEAIFENIKLRADIFVLDDFKIIEIVKSETNESLERKKMECKKLRLKMEVVRI